MLHEKSQLNSHWSMWAMNSFRAWLEGLVPKCFRPIFTKSVPHVPQESMPIVIRWHCFTSKYNYNEAKLLIFRVL